MSQHDESDSDGRPENDPGQKMTLVVKTENDPGFHTSINMKTENDPGSNMDRKMILVSKRKMILVFGPNHVCGDKVFYLH